MWDKKRLILFIIGLRIEFINFKYMIEFFIITRFIGSIATLVVGLWLIWRLRKKNELKAGEDVPAGFWARAVCFGTDLAIIEILNLFLAFHGSLQAAGYITFLVTFSYFFFFWLFFSATPAQMFARIRIISGGSAPLKIWQVLARLGMFLFLFVGWIMILFDKKEKRALQDIVARTKVVYTAEKIKIQLKEGLAQKLQFAALSIMAILLISLGVFGSGERMRQYSENSQIRFFDINRDGAPDGLTMDLNEDGKSDVFKYDLNNDGVVDFTTFDTDNDGIAESIDNNNDGRIDGYDFDNDNKLDMNVFGGQLFIWLWRLWFGILCLGFAGVLVFIILKERRK